MDTSSSPWDTPTAAVTSEAAETSGGGWADFGSFSTTNDSGSSDIIEKQQSEVMNVEDRPEDESSESWRPSMASSPEATMLDCSQEEAGDEDKAAGAGDQQTAAADASERLKHEVDKLGDAAAQPAAESGESLEDNFNFLSKRGMMSAPSETVTTVTSPEATEQSQQ